MKPICAHLATLSTVLGLAVAPASDIRAQDTPQIEWSESVAEALDLAAAENRIVFVAVNMDGESANDRLARQSYHRPAIVEWAERTVPIIASRFDHKSEGGGCPRFGGIECSHHRSAERTLRSRKLVIADDEGWVIAPQHVFLTPTGEVLLSVPYLITENELLWCFHAAMRAHDPEFREALPAGASKPRRAVLGKQFDATKDPAPTTEDVMAMIELAKQAPTGSKRVDAMRPLIELDHDAARTFVAAELTEGWTSGQGERMRKRILNAIGATAPPSWATLTAEYLDHSNRSVRSEAAIALEQLGSPDSVKQLTERLSDEGDDRVRAALMRALGRCGGDDKNVRRKLLKLARTEKSHPPAAAVLLALGALSPHPDIAKTLTKSLRNKVVRTARAAACGIAMTHDAELLSVLETKLEKTKDTKPNSALRQDLELAIEVLRGDAQIDAIAESVKDLGGDDSDRRRIFGRPGR